MTNLVYEQRVYEQNNNYPDAPAPWRGGPGSDDGHMRAYAAEDGKVLWDFDNAPGDFETVNGVPGHGGSIDGPGAVVVKGMVYVNSGYSRQSGMPGYDLLAFE